MKKLTSFLPWSDLAVDYSSLILRFSLGFLLIKGHGWHKFLNILEGNFEFGDPIGIGPTASLVLSAVTEVGCSLLLILGLWTRLVIIPLVFTMLVIIFCVQIPMDFPWEKIESALQFLIPYFALFFLGSGKYSLDHFLGKK